MSTCSWPISLHQIDAAAIVYPSSPILRAQVCRHFVCDTMTTVRSSSNKDTRINIFSLYIINTRSRYIIVESPQLDHLRHVPTALLYVVLRSDP